MYNQRDSLQAHTYAEAIKLAAAGEEFSHLIKIMTPEYALRLKIFVQQLPDNIREKTIYGMAVSKMPAKNVRKK
jgi:hypothetical protein